MQAHTASDEEGFNLKQLALGRLRPIIEPRLPKHNLTWEQVEKVAATVSVGRGQQIIEDPEAFLQSLAEAAGPYAMRLALVKLRPKLEPAMMRHGLTWQDAVPAFELLDSG